jgi:hypothetical protein
MATDTKTSHFGAEVFVNNYLALQKIALAASPLSIFFSVVLDLINQDFEGG